MRILRHDKESEKFLERRKWKKIAGLVRAFVILLSLGVVAEFVFFQESEAELQSKIALIERRVLTETEFGREIANFIKTQNATYVLKKDFPTESYCMVAEDQIFYKPFPLQMQKKLLLLGKPIRIMRNFHEEIHRA